MAGRAPESLLFPATPMRPELQAFLGDSTLVGMTRAEFHHDNPYLPIQQGLERAIIGQDEAIDGIMSALNRERLRNPDRPIANLLFMGPTGVGKSQTAKELARLLRTGDGESFLQIDCSTYSQDHTVSAMLGSPPGYVGRGQKPVLDPAIIEKPRSVVLFDEIEKGSPTLWDTLLQIMDNGEIALLNQNKKVSFRNSIIIMTSNVGSGNIANLLETKSFGFHTSRTNTTPPQVTKRQVDKVALDALKERFRPEFINRFDRRVVFTSLDDSQLATILKQYVATANKRYGAQGYHLDISPALIGKLVSDVEERSQFGARPVLRAFDSKVESLFAELINSGGIPPGSRAYAVAQSELSNSERTGAPDDIAFFYRCALPPSPAKAPPQSPPRKKESSNTVTHRATAK